MRVEDRDHVKVVLRDKRKGLDHRYQIRVNIVPTIPRFITVLDSISGTGGIRHLVVHDERFGLSVLSALSTTSKNLAPIRVTFSTYERSQVNAFSIIILCRIILHRCLF